MSLLPDFVSGLRTFLPHVFANLLVPALPKAAYAALIGLLIFLLVLALLLLLGRFIDWKSQNPDVGRKIVMACLAIAAAQQLWTAAHTPRSSNSFVQVKFPPTVSIETVVLPGVPCSAIRDQVQQTVRIRVSFNPSGKAINMLILGGDSLLYSRSMAAIDNWTFRLMPLRKPTYGEADVELRYYPCPLQWFRKLMPD